MVPRLGIPACVTASLICGRLAPGNSDQSRAIAPVTKGAAALVPPNVCGLPFVPEAGNVLPGALSPRLPIEFPRFDSPQRFALKIAGGHWNHPRMAGDGGTSHRSLIARCGHGNNAAMGGVVQSLLQLAFAFRRWLERGRNSG